MAFSFSVALLFLSFSVQQAVRATCPPVSGTFTVDEIDLFPESADWDDVNCKLYLGSLYNVSVVIYDPYDKTSNIITLPGLTSNSPQQVSTADYHISGIDFDGRSKSMYFAASSAPPFTSNNPANMNLTGPNQIVRYDTVNRKIAYEANLMPAQNEFHAKTGNYTSGFQDMAETGDGSTYAIGTFGSSIVKIDPSGHPSLYYAPSAYNAAYGFGGIFSTGSKLVISDSISKGFVVFDTTACPPAPKNVRPSNVPSNYTSVVADGLTAPAKYNGEIALWSDDIRGTVIYGSKDGWSSAEYIGAVADNAPGTAGGSGSDTFEIGNSIYVVTEFFQSASFQTKTSFPFVDITQQVDDLVRAWKHK